MLEGHTGPDAAGKVIEAFGTFWSAAILPSVSSCS
jgi:hypothetical protein